MAESPILQSNILQAVRCLKVTLDIKSNAVEGRVQKTS